MAEPVEGLSPMTRLIRWRSGVTHETWRIVQPLLDAPPQWKPISRGGGAQTNCSPGTRVGATPGLIRARREGPVRVPARQAERAERFEGEVARLAPFVEPGVVAVGHPHDPRGRVRVLGGQPGRTAAASHRGSPMSGSAGAGSARSSSRAPSTCDQDRTGREQAPSEKYGPRRGPHRVASRYARRQQYFCSCVCFRDCQ
jgi:hypothetical protein